MQSDATISEVYLDTLPDSRKVPMKMLRAVSRKHQPSAFKGCMNDDLLCHVVPRSRYVAGYHCNPVLLERFQSEICQKSHR